MRGDRIEWGYFQSESIKLLGLAFPPNGALSPKKFGTNDPNPPLESCHKPFLRPSFFFSAVVFPNNRRSQIK
jgi:hypothetical protein